MLGPRLSNLLKGEYREIQGASHGLGHRTEAVA